MVPRGFASREGQPHFSVLFGPHGLYEGKQRANCFKRRGDPLRRIFRWSKAMKRFFSCARNAVHVALSAVTCMSAIPDSPSVTGMPLLRMTTVPAHSSALVKVKSYVASIPSDRPR